jgi:hypothetical protein
LFRLERFQPLKDFWHRVERFSLDAVFVAVLWCVALWQVAGVGMDEGSLLVLTLATWLTYVADRLRDTAPGKAVPDTCRHLYYRDHYKAFRKAWLGTFPLTVLLAFVFLPMWKFLWGWVLVALILVYLHLLGRMKVASHRLLLKRLAVPLIFTVGVGWMAEGWRTMEAGAALLVLFFAALVNVLLISQAEAKGEASPVWLPGLTGGAMVLLVLAGNGALLIHWPVGIAALYCALVYFVLLLRIRERGVELIRLWTDATLADGAILILILQYLF